jgi:hypothetical protein
MRLYLVLLLVSMAQELGIVAGTEVITNPSLK